MHTSCTFSASRKTSILKYQRSISGEIRKGAEMLRSETEVERRKERGIEEGGREVKVDTWRSSPSK